MRRVFVELAQGMSPRRLGPAGAIVALAGWAVFALVAAISMVGPPLRSLDAMIGLALALFLLTSGAALLILATLRAGFGSLDWFFREALARSAQRAAAPPQDKPARSPGEAARRGYIGERPFTLYDDGTVAVETLLGMRVFASMAEAQEFIGA